MAQRYQLLIRDRHGFERTVPITRSVTVGRQSLCDVVLSDNMISRNHLRLELQEDTWWAEDLQTTHGSFYLNKPLGRAAWEPGTPLQLADGAYTLTLVRTDHSSSEIHLQAILDAAQLLAQEVDLEDMLEQSLDRLLSISGTDRGFLMLLEEGELASRVQRNLGQELEGQIQLSMSSVHKVFETGDPIWILNVAEDGQLLSQHSVQRLELKTILCLPLLLQGRRMHQRHVGLAPRNQDTKALAMFWSALFDGLLLAWIIDPHTDLDAQVDRLGFTCRRGRQSIERLVKTIEHVELETTPDFFEVFVEGCQFKPMPKELVPSAAVEKYS